MLLPSYLIWSCLFLAVKAIPQTYTDDMSEWLTRDRRLMVVNKGTWPKGIFPYTIEPSALYQKPELEHVMSFVEDQSCIRFTYWNQSTSSLLGLNNPGHINFYKGDGCHSFTVGIHRSPKGSRVSCCQGKSCLHEIGHALGFFHEQINPNRDGWIRINSENVKKGAAHIYTKTKNRNANTSLPFDISSVMHYQDWAFSAGGPTFTNLFPELTVGYQQFYFFMEIAGGYRCNEKPQCKGKVLGCENDGYQTILHGKCACKCPPGLDPENMCKTPLKRITLSSWPKGQYALPKPRTGCPRGGAFQDGHLSYSGTGGNGMSTPYHMAGEVRGTKIDLHFCSKTTRDEAYDFVEGSKFNWPNGNYCIYRKGGRCPKGFTSGSIHHRSTTTPSTSGQIPDGVYGNDVELKLCCSWRGFHEVPMAFPTNKPFTLFKHPKDRKCQAVEGMRFTEETFTITSSRKLKIDPMFWAWRKNYYRSLVVTLCHYRRVDMECGDVITLTKSKPEVTIQMSGSGSTDLECTWLVKGNDDTGTLILDFEEFNLKKNGKSCDDKMVVRHARIGQWGQDYKAIDCTPDRQQPPQSIRSIFDKIHLSFFTNGDSKSSFKAKIRWITNEDMCYDVEDRGASYDGNINYTRSFQTCLPWAEMTECPHNPFVSGDTLDNLEGNACRNPDTSFHPWCYTKKDGCAREYCDVCGLEKSYDRIKDCDKLRNQGFCTVDAARAVRVCAKTCWDLLPNIAPVKKYPDVSCSSPTPPFDGTMLETLKPKYKVGESVQYKCHSLSSVVKSKCLTSGQWSNIGSSCLLCSGDQKFVNNKCYGLNKDKNNFLTYDQVMASCKRDGGVMIAPKSIEESELMLDIANKYPTLWIAITDRTTEGTFRYEDGTKLVWKNWGPSEPNNRGRNGEDCAAMNRNTKWIDVPCSYRYPGICAFPPFENSKCEDVLKDHCVSLLTDRPSLCTDQLDFARQYCRKSCGICKDNQILCPVKNPDPNVLTLSVQESMISVGEFIDYDCERFSYHVGGHKSRACLPDGTLSGKPLECGECPAGFKMLNNACHGLVLDDGMLTFEDAKRACKKMDGFLAMPKTKEENDLISSIGLGKAIRIGVTNTYSDEFVWEDGVAIDWNNWAKGHSNKGTFRHCAVMDDKKEWLNVLCSPKRSLPIVCTISKSDDDLCYDMDDGGVSYDGWVNYTQTSQPCVPWTQVTKCPHHSFNNPDDNLENNYCRNPDNSYRPWCYTDKNRCNRNYCDVCGTNKQRDRIENCQALKSQGLCTKDKNKAKRDCIATCRDELNIKVPKIKKYTDIRCGPPKPPMDGVVVVKVRNQYKIGNTVEIKCKSESWSVFSRCLTSGHWSEIETACVQHDCLVNIFDNTCYYWQKDPLRYNYDEAVAVCKERNAIVASPRNQNEANFIRNIVPRENIMLGINDRNTEGTWVYQDGSQVVWTNWNGVEPNNIGKEGEQCAEMDRRTGWLDVPCSFKRQIVCASPRKELDICSDFFVTKCRNQLEQKPNMCKAHEGYSRIYCAKTCGFCRDD